MKNKIAVFGGAGFIGSNLVDKLIEDGESVIVFDDFSTGKLENVNVKAEIITLDVSQTTPATLSKYLIECNKVFYLAALARVQLSFDNVLRYNEVNITGLLNTLEAMLIANINRIVFSSSSSVYADAEILPTPEDCKTNPMSPYATQKLAAENYLYSYTLKHNIFSTCLRYFNVYGERMQTEGAYSTVIGKFLKKLKSSDGNNVLEITNDGAQRRDFTYVGDVVNANLRAMKQLEAEIAKSKNPEIKYKKFFIYNTGTGENYSVLDIASLFPLKHKYIGEVIEPKETLADNTAIRFKLGWTPTVNVLEWVEQEIKKIKG
jgi:UDP-glucose 4-epimerase